jgi:hypothetical protein
VVVGWKVMKTEMIGHVILVIMFLMNRKIERKCLNPTRLVQYVGEAETLELMELLFMIAHRKLLKYVTNVMEVEKL